ncbi:hypothetical protein [Gracilibacillus thailandensis]|nr:hypothetical protein [Gracilibacillus thailandensis]
MSYIVKSVDHVLSEHFKLEEGLAIVIQEKIEEVVRKSGGWQSIFN